MLPLNLSDTRQHMAALAKLGGRRIGSAGYAEAAKYLRENLLLMGIAPQTLTFETPQGLGGRQIVPLLLGAAATWWASRRDRWQSWWGIACFGLLWQLQNALLGRPALWQALLPKTEARLIVGKIPAQRGARRTVVLTANFDSAPQPAVTAFAGHRAVDFGTASLALAGLWALLDPTDDDAPPSLAMSGLAANLVAAAAWIGLSGVRPQTNLNDNLTSVALLLCVAAHLQQHPLPHTDVWVVFNGAATVGGGMRHFLDTHRLPNLVAISVRGVGAGELCWASEYRPYATVVQEADATMLERATRLAAENPAMGVMGRRMPFLDDGVSDYHTHQRYLSLVGYDRATGSIPNIRAVDAVDGAALQKAGDFLGLLLNDL